MDIRCNVINVVLHAWDVHPFNWGLASRAPSSTRVGGGGIGMNNDVGWNVNTITSHGQCDGITKPITFLFYHSIAPKHELIVPKHESQSGKGWSRAEGRSQWIK